jgi:cystathionine beta-lyase
VTRPAEDGVTVPPLRQLQARRSEKWAVFEPDVLSLTVAEMDFPVFADVRRAVTELIAGSDLGYAVPATRGLREALAGFARRRLHWQVDIDQVTVIPDVMLGIVDLCRVLAGPDGAVSFATPAYPPFFREPALAGLQTIPVGLTATGSIDLTHLETVLRGGTVRALILSNPHNPTGRVLPREELAAVAELCAAHEVWVLADEIHAALTFPGATHVPWFEVSDAARRWGIVLTSASKAFNLAALKTAFIVTACSAARDVVQRIGPQHDHASLLGEVAAEVALRDGDQWLDQVLAQLVANRDHLAAELNQRLPEVRWRIPQATYLAWLDCRALQLDAEPAEVFLARGRVALGPGLNYSPAQQGFARLNFATSPALLTEAVTRMQRALDTPVN